MVDMGGRDAKLHDSPDALRFFAGFQAFTPAGIPEPSTWAMMLVGFAGLGCFGWRKRMGAPAAA